MSYPGAKTDAALDMVAKLKMTEHDFLDLAIACINQAGMSFRQFKAAIAGAQSHPIVEPTIRQVASVAHELLAEKS